MEDNKKNVFDPSKSRAIAVLLNKSKNEILNRYCQPRVGDSKSFLEKINDVINTADDDGYLVYTEICNLDGYNLNHLTTIINLESSKLKKLGYEYKLNQLIRDLDTILQEYPEEISKIKDNPNTESAFLTQFIRYFDREVFENVIMHELQNGKQAHV